MNDLDLFANAGDGLAPEHFGIDEHGRAYVIASVFAKAMGYSSTQKATDLVDEDEKGYEDIQSRSTSGVEQIRRVVVIYEDGIWELIFRSTLPSARSIKARVKAILRELRETGVVDTRPPMTELEMARNYVAALERLAELEPAAHSWNALAAADGDYAVADAAKILSRDPAITIGRDRLFDFMQRQGWVFRAGDRRWRADQKTAVDTGRLAEAPQTSVDPDTGERVNRAPQVRVTVKGIHELHKRLGGSGPVLLEVAS